MFPSHSSGRQVKSGQQEQAVPEALCVKMFLSLLPMISLVKNALFVMFSLRIVPWAPCQNSAKHLSISASDLRFVFTLVHSRIAE